MIEVETPDQGCRNLRWAIALFDGLVGGGLRHVVLSPGSRSTPLVLAARRQPQLVLTPILDERSAAFFALGVADHRHILWRWSAPQGVPWRIGFPR
jgi:2-succinyl-5-enolpyruvyl-6-hydroxy-3-cyclohexene-1-carboxylate synthase